MKNVYLRTIAASAIIGSASLCTEAREINLQGITFTVDTIQHYLAGPATKYSRILVSSPNNKFNASVLEIDLSAENHPEIKVEVGKDCIRTAETISSMAKRKSDTEKRYIAGINGDFFVTSSFATALANSFNTDPNYKNVTKDDFMGNPNTTCATNGMIVAPNFIDAASKEKALVICENGDMYIDATEITGKFSTVPNSNGSMKYIDFRQPGQAIVNFPRSDQNLFFYNRYYGGSTRTDDTGVEVTLELKEGEKFSINKPFVMKVVSAPAKVGNSKIPENGAVISAGKNRTSQIEWINKLKVGDDVTIELNVKLSKAGISPAGIKEIVGGDVRILNEGNVTQKGDPDALRFINEPTAKYIRTMIGYSQDRKKMVMCTVDRECGGTGGVSYFDAADLMREYGCYDALDLDGGGSTEMYLHTPGVVNYLRDKVERAVGNAIYAVVNAPEDNTVRQIRFMDHALKIKKGDSYKPVFLGYNNNLELLSMDVQEGVKLSAPAELGKVSSDGTFTATGSGTHLLTATFNGTTTSIPVTVLDGSGVEENLADEGNAVVEYYDMTGAKVEEPQKGNIYVVRRGNTITKAIY